MRLGFALTSPPDRSCPDNRPIMKAERINPHARRRTHRHANSISSGCTSIRRIVKPNARRSPRAGSKGPPYRRPGCAGLPTRTFITRTHRQRTAHAAHVRRPPRPVARQTTTARRSRVGNEQEVEAPIHWISTRLLIRISAMHTRVPTRQERWCLRRIERWPRHSGSTDRAHVPLMSPARQALIGTVRKIGVGRKDSLDSPAGRAFARRRAGTSRTHSQAISSHHV